MVTRLISRELRQRLRAPRRHADLATELRRLREREASLETICAEAPIQLMRIRARISVLVEAEGETP